MDYAKYKACISNSTKVIAKFNNYNRQIGHTTTCLDLSKQGHENLINCTIIQFSPFSDSVNSCAKSREI